jgi:hypothetical protein
LLAALFGYRSTHGTVGSVRSYIDRTSREEDVVSQVCASSTYLLFSAMVDGVGLQGLGIQT